MNVFQLLQLATQIGNVLNGLPESIKKKYAKTDALLYIAVREFAKQLERRNPNVWEATGYVSAIEDLD